MINEINYVNSNSRNAHIRGLAQVYGLVHGVTDTAIKLMAHTNQLGSELLNPPRGDDARIDFAIANRNMLHQCAMDAEWSIYNRLVATAQTAFDYLSCNQVMPEADFADALGRRTAVLNYIATLNWMGSAWVAISLLDKRKGRPVESANQRKTVWPHKGLIYLGPENKRFEAVPEDYFSDAVAWLNSLPEWPYEVDANQERQSLFYAVMAQLACNWTSATITDHFLNQGDIDWLSRLFEGKGWRVSSGMACEFLHEHYYTFTSPLVRR
ncbi:MAG: hypothetical protein KC652_07325 [Cyanobacteria bacterium HKST-UBA01]|nr:hypothetical protein [Cyanobacteria bacterium HKST-UBA01]